MIINGFTQGAGRGGRLRDGRRGVAIGIRNGSMVLMMVLCLCLSEGMGRTSRAADIVTEAYAGYDSNPSETSDGKGSGFTSFSLGVTGQCPLGETLILEMFPMFHYQDLWDFQDNYLFSAELSLAPRVPVGSFLPRLFMRGQAYRDGYIEEDERNEFALGAGVDWLVNGRYTLLFEGAWQSIRHLSPSAPFPRVSWEPGKASGQGEGGNSMFYEEQPAREDTDVELRVGIEIFLTPDLTGTVSVQYNQVDSSLDIESYRQITPEIKLAWQFRDQWRLTANGSWEYRDYTNLDDSSGGCGCDTGMGAGSGSGNMGMGGGDETILREITRGFFLGLQVSRFFDTMEVFAHVSRETGEYPLDNEEYERVVMQCGVSWSF